MATDDFNRASLGANWTDPASDYAIVDSTKLTKTSGDTDKTCCYWNADSFSDDHYSEVVFQTVADVPMGPVVRASGNTFYGVSARGTGYDHAQVFKSVAGAFTEIAVISSITWGNTDKLKITVEGANPATLKVYRNDVQIGTDYTDSDIDSGGAPGIWAYIGGYSFVDSWEGGDLTAADILAVFLGEPTIGSSTIS